jgi:hypothetical protein
MPNNYENLFALQSSDATMAISSILGFHWRKAERSWPPRNQPWCRTKRLSGSPRKIIVVAASRLRDTRIVDQLLCARSHENFAIGSVPRQAPTLEDLVASATEQCAPVLVKVRRRLTTSDRWQTKIAFQLGSCLDRLPLDEEELWRRTWKRRG